MYKYSQQARAWSSALSSHARSRSSEHRAVLHLARGDACFLRRIRPRRRPELHRTCVGRRCLRHRRHKLLAFELPLSASERRRQAVEITPATRPLEVLVSPRFLVISVSTTSLRLGCSCLLALIS